MSNNNHKHNHRWMEKSRRKRRRKRTPVSSARKRSSIIVEVSVVTRLVSECHFRGPSGVERLSVAFEREGLGGVGLETDSPDCMAVIPGGKRGG